MTKWVILCLDPEIFWSTKETKVQFRGFEFLLRPETEKQAPSIAMSYDDSALTFRQAIHITRQLLSSLAWVKTGGAARGVREISSYGGGHPFQCGKGKQLSLVDPNFNLGNLPDPSDPKARLTLSISREALNVNSIPYSFLGFFKIINIRFRKDREQKDWIRRFACHAGFGRVPDRKGIQSAQIVRSPGPSRDIN